MGTGHYCVEEISKQRLQSCLGESRINRLVHFRLVAGVTVLGRTGLIPQAYVEVTTGKQVSAYYMILLCWLCLCLFFAPGKSLFSIQLT